MTAIQIVTNYYFWLTVLGLIGTWFAWKKADKNRTRAAFADTANEKKRFRRRAVTSRITMVLFILIGLQAAALFVMQVLGRDIPVNLAIFASLPDLSQVFPEATETAMPEETVIPTALPSQSPQESTSSPEPTIAVSPTPVRLAQVAVGNTNFRGVNLRAEPGLSGKILAKLPNGTVLIVIDLPTELADGYNWQRVETLEGVQGWVVEDFLLPIEP